MAQHEQSIGGRFWKFVAAGWQRSTRNDYLNGIRNGTLGTITDISHRQRTVR